jgi:pimeloyl-ACP methyl ester carboxylesterase
MVCSPRLARGLVCLVSIAFLAAAAAAAPAVSRAAPAPPTPPAPPSAAAAPGVALSTCRLGGVADDARCGVYEVFENRAAAKGRRIGLKLAVLPAKGPHREPDPIVVIPGGPGQDAVASAKIFADLFAAARETRDLVLIDQRGTGGSNPLNCKLPGSSDDPQGYLGDLIPIEAVRQCLQGLDADPALYTTPIAMEDLDEVRQALGYDRINLYGASYGSRAALVYMRAHPEHVRSAMLSGLVPTDMKIPLYQARDAQRAMDLLLDDCAADKACSTTFPDIRAKFNAVRERLAKAPVGVDLHDVMTRRDIHLTLNRDLFDEEMRWRLYDEEANLVPLFVAQAYEGNYSTIAAAILRLRRAVAAGNIVSLGAFLSVTCAEDVPYIDQAEARRLAAGTFLGTYRVDQQTRACQVWPRGKVPAGYFEPVRSAVPALLLSGRRDPVTPPPWGERVARTLPHARQVILREGFHAERSPCVSRVFAQFLARGAADGLDLSCAAEGVAMTFAMPSNIKAAAAAAPHNDALAALAASPSKPAPGPSPDGLWDGVIYFRRGDVEVEAVVELARVGGGYIGTLDLPSQGLKFVPLENVKAEGDAISFSFQRNSRTAGMVVHSTFSGRIAPDGKTMSGDFREENTKPFPFRLARRGEAGSDRPAPPLQALHELGDDGAQLKAAFNQDQGKVRVLMMLSPTCPVCLMHARVVYRDLLQQLPGEGFRIYAVWGPMLGEEKQADAQAATVNLPDPRVLHFWIGDDSLAKSFVPRLGWSHLNNVLAWNTFMVFKPAQAWGAELPPPDYLMYVEKPLPAERLFNGEKLAEQVRGLLGGK